MLYLNVVTLRVDGAPTAHRSSIVRVAPGGHFDIVPSLGRTLDDAGKAVDITDSGASYVWLSLQEPNQAEAIAYTKERITSAVMRVVQDTMERVAMADGHADDKAIAMQRLTVTTRLAHLLSNLCHVR